MREDARSLGDTLTREHRRLDELFGKFLAAASAGDAEETRRAIGAFDSELRRHTAFEEERLLPSSSRYDFDVRLVPEEGRWKVAWAAWQPVS